MNAPGFYGCGCPCDMCQPRPTDAQPIHLAMVGHTTGRQAVCDDYNVMNSPCLTYIPERATCSVCAQLLASGQVVNTGNGFEASHHPLKEMAESMAKGYFGRREHDGPCEIERVEPGWNVQADSGEVFVSDDEIAELRDKLEGGDIQAARLIAERYSAAYADGFAAGVELGESRAAAPVEAAPDLAPGVEFALEVLSRRLELTRWNPFLAVEFKASAISIAKDLIGDLRDKATKRGVVLGAKVEP